MEFKKEWVDLLIIIAAVLILLIQGILILRMVRAKRNEKLDVKEWLEESEEITSTEDQWDGLQEGTGIHNGKEYRYTYTPASKYSPSSLRVTIEAASSGSFKIRPENRADRFFKKVGLVSEVQTHDPDFDNNFFIQTDTPGFTSAFLMHTKRRYVIREIFSDGFTSVRHDGTSMVAEWTPFVVTGELDSHTIAKSAGRLVELSRNMPDIPPEAGMRLTGWKVKRGVAFAVPFLLLIGGYVLLVFGGANYPPLDLRDIVFDSFKYSVPAMVVFIWLAVLLLRGRSSSHMELLIVAALSLPAFPLSGAGAEITLNGFLDDSEQAVHVVPVVKKNAEKSQTGVKYYATVKSWRKKRETERFRVDPGFFRKAVPGKTEASVVTQQGWCGFEWLVSHKLSIK